MSIRSPRPRPITDGPRCGTQSLPTPCPHPVSPASRNGNGGGSYGAHWGGGPAGRGQTGPSPPWYGRITTGWSTAPSGTGHRATRAAISVTRARLGHSRIQ